MQQGQFAQKIDEGEWPYIESLEFPAGTPATNRASGTETEQIEKGIILDIVDFRFSS